MIQIGEKTFNTKNQAIDHIREILYRYPLNQSVKGSDLIFMCDLLDLHPDKDRRIGVGIKSIIIEQDGEFNKTRHFSIIRTDDSSIDFSFNKCLSPNLNEPIKLFKSAARRAIADQIILFRNSSFHDSTQKILCEITGVLIDKNNSHIDHTPPDTFDKIVLDFLNTNNINVDDVKFIEAPNGIGKVFANDNLKNSFADYHKTNAKLRVISPGANLKQKKK